MITSGLLPADNNLNLNFCNIELLHVVSDNYLNVRILLITRYIIIHKDSISTQTLYDVIVDK